MNTRKRQRARRLTVHLTRVHAERLQIAIEFWDRPWNQLGNFEPIVLGTTNTRGAQRSISTAYRLSGYRPMGRWRRQVAASVEEHWVRSFEHPEADMRQVIANIEAGMARAAELVELYGGQAEPEP